MLAIALVALVPVRSATADSVPPGAPVVTLALAGPAAGPAPGAVTIDWRPPTVHGSSPITGYLYATSIDGGHTWTAPVSLGGTNLFIVSQILPAATCHNTAPGSQGCTYRIYAKNSAGIGAPSKDVPLWVSPSVPGPRAVGPGDAAFSKVVLLWSPPKTDGGFPVTYTVLASMDNAPAVPVTTTSTTSTVIPCTGSQTCAYRVQAENAQGKSPPGNPQTVITAPGPVTLAAAQNTGGALGSGTTTVHLSWSAPETGMFAVSYQLQRCAIPAGVSTGCTTTTGAWGNTALVTRPSVGSAVATQPCGQGVATCRYRVRALNARGGSGAWHMTGIEPWAPFGVRVAPGPTKGTVTVTFNGPAESGAGSVSAKHYQVLFCTSTCTDGTRWRDSGLKVPYPPKGTAPFSAGTFACKNPVTTLTCVVRMRFIDGLGHVSALTSAISGSPRR